MAEPIDRCELNHRLGSPLTPRQLRVMAEYLTHDSRRDVARCLGISDDTVQGHLKRILARTGCASIRQVGLHLGWTSIPAGLVEHGRG